MKIALICTGTELLKGSCCNTDLAFAGAKLTEAGMPPHLEVTVGDRPDELAFALGAALKQADTLLVSGGLGPDGQRDCGGKQSSQDKRKMFHDVCSFMLMA